MNVHEVHALTRHQQELTKAHEISRHADSLERIHEEQMRRVYAALDRRMKSAKRWGTVVATINEIKQSETAADAAKQIASIVASEREQDNKPEPEQNLDDETASTATSVLESLVSPPQQVLSASTTKEGEDVALPNASNPDRQSLKVSFSTPLSVEHPSTTDSTNLPDLQSLSTGDLDVSSLLSSSDDDDDLTDFDDDDELPPIGLSPSLRPGDIPEGQQEQQAEIVRENHPRAKISGADSISKQSVAKNATAFSRTQQVMKASLAEMLAKYETDKPKELEDVVELDDYDSNDDGSSYTDSLDDEEVDYTFEVPDAAEYLAGIGHPRRIRGIRRVPSMKEIN